jgi:hypothetical protein
MSGLETVRAVRFDRARGVRAVGRFCCEDAVLEFGHVAARVDLDLGDASPPDEILPGIAA